MLHKYKFEMYLEENQISNSMNSMPAAWCLAALARATRNLSKIFFIRHYNMLQDPIRCQRGKPEIPAAFSVPPPSFLFPDPSSDQFPAASTDSLVSIANAPAMPCRTSSLACPSSCSLVKGSRGSTHDVSPWPWKYGMAALTPTKP